MGANCHNDIRLMGTAVRYLKSRLNIIISKALDLYSVGRVLYLTHMTFVVLYVPRQRVQDAETAMMQDQEHIGNVEKG
jgi:hypothetical protein